MGDTIAQYRAAIGNFYISCSVILKRATFVIFYMSKLIHYLCKCSRSIKGYVMSLSSVSLELGFLFQFLFFILLLSGDIELNPGPMYDRVIDIFHLNVRSIRNKIDDLYAIVHEFDIVCFTETHLDKNVTDDQIKIDGFNCIFRKDRNCYGGGVLIYLSSPIQAIRRSDLEPANVECIWVEIENSTSNFFSMLCIPSSTRRYDFLDKPFLVRRKSRRIFG
jgi:hypothetical protein